MKKFLVKLAINVLIKYVDNLTDEFQDGIQKRDFIDALKKLK